jgi:hypothetical protein
LFFLLMIPYQNGTRKTTQTQREEVEETIEERVEAKEGRKRKGGGEGSQRGRGARSRGARARGRLMRWG